MAASAMTSLKSKLIRTTMGTLAVVVLATLGIVAALQVNATREHQLSIEAQIEHRLDEKGQARAEGDALAMRSMFEDNAFSDIGQLVEHVVDRDPEILYGIAVDATGRAIVSVGEPGGPGTKVTPIEATGVERVTAAARRLTTWRGEPVLEFVHPVLSNGESIGSVRYGLSTHAMRDTVAATRSASYRSMASGLVAIGLTGLLALIVGSIVTRRQAHRITVPLAALSEAAQAIAAGDLSIRVVIQSGDEVQRLGDTFNQMSADLEKTYSDLASLNRTLEERVERRTAELRATQRELLKTARKAGMAEVATGVLHNVGNVLNSVQTSMTLLVDQQRANRPLDGLKRSVQLIDANLDDLSHFMTDDPKGPRLMGYLGKLATLFEQEHGQRQAHLTRLRSGVEHICGIIQAQQSNARCSIVEAADLSELVEEAVLLAGVEGRCELVRRFDPVGLALVEREKVVEILVNLICNAVEAVGAVSDPVRPGRIELCVGPFEDRVLFSIQDNGCGIAAGALDRVFNHGFSTKKDGHGFGLHTAANAASAMGGRLSVTSEGVGRGARFELRLQRALDDTLISGQHLAQHLTDRI